MIRRLLRVAAPALAALAIGGPAQGASSEPAWSVHYRFGTILYGGTSFDLDANGRYALIASSMRLARRDRARLGRRHPTADVFLGTSRETGEIFEQAMADCGAPVGYGFAAPEFVVPRGTRWVLKVTRNENGDVVALDVDDAGRAFARRKNGERVLPELAAPR
jgi:hypothetical protein